MEPLDLLSFLTEDDIAHEVSQLTYRPGWRLDVFGDPFEGPQLYVTMLLDDSYNPGTKVALRVRSAIPPMPSVDYLHVWLTWRLQQIEIHECREFLRKGGVPLFDPHQPIEPGSPG